MLTSYRLLKFSMSERSNKGITLSVANVAICDFFFDWRLKSASGDFFGA
jgi:hypothetical protein